MRRENSVGVEVREIQNYPKERILKSLLTTAMELECPVALWRLPMSDEIHLVISFSEVISNPKLDIEETVSGFTFNPFDLSRPNLLIKDDFYLSFRFEELSCNYDFNNEIKSSKEKDFVDFLFQNLDNGQEGIQKQAVAPRVTSEMPDYKDLVSDSVEKIKSGHFQKVVPSRRKEINLPEDFDVVAALLNLCDTYPSAFVSLVSIPDVGSWLGATPEVLLEVVKGKTFKTVALAATQKRDETKPLSETAWTQKEIEEQAMVSRYIINCFKKIRLREFEERGPKTIAAGNLLHLKTDYEVDMEATNFPQLGTVMLELLHPTSAVAGMPKESSLEFLSQNEGFDREFFSGFLGPVNIDQNTNIYVNLRCMKLFNGKAWLYAGAGVTEDSNPEKELLETEMKFNTLLNVIATTS